MMRVMKILVIGGGGFGEREVSLRSAAAVREALEKLGHEVDFADPANGEDALRKAIAGSELALPILHGEGGEDGTVQALIEDMGKPYLGADAEASQLCFNKAALKERLRAAGIRTPASELVDREGFERSELRRRPFVLKPFDSGSSIDMFIVRDVGVGLDGPRAAFERRPQMLLEELIGGTEITVAVLGETALPVVEIIPPAGQEFDYENKYNGATAEICPPEHIGMETGRRAQQLAEEVHRLAGVRHLSRTDMIVTPPGELYVLEVNTLPGLTAQSLYPKAAAAAGLDWKHLVERLVKLAVDGRQGRAAKFLS